MKPITSTLLLLFVNICTSYKQQNPIDFQERLVGEWEVVNSKNEEPDLLIYPINDDGLFIYDDLSGK